MTDYLQYVGRQCQKKRKGMVGKQPKPFKSGNKINTIKGVTINPNTGKEAFLFEEDESCVNCDSIIIL